MSELKKIKRAVITRNISTKRILLWRWVHFSSRSVTTCIYICTMNGVRATSCDTSCDTIIYKYNNLIGENYDDTFGNIKIKYVI